MKPFTMTWKEWKGFMLNELSQRKTDTKYHTVAFTCEFFESSKPRYTLLTTQNNLINTRGRWGGWGIRGWG